MIVSSDSDEVIVSTAAFFPWQAFIVIHITCWQTSVAALNLSWLTSAFYMSVSIFSWLAL
jgi:hypothetical protein